MGESVNWLKEQVDRISYDENLFRISLGDDKYIFGAILRNTKGKPDYFAISTIYDTIVDLNHKIKYSFYAAAECELPETLDKHTCFGNPPKAERTAIYFIENMVFRTSILWDLLAQLCNVHWCLNKPTDKIYAQQFFHDCAQGKKAHPFAKQVYEYLIKADDVGEVTETWNGNHAYVKEYRDKMTHRNSPNISTLSAFAIELRPPAMFVLKRVTEDYFKATEFIETMINEISKSFADFKLFTQEKE